MKVWVCIKVVDAYAGEEEPICETRIALSAAKACVALRELVGEEPVALENEPFTVAQELSEDDRHLYVEEHTIGREDVVLAIMNEEMERIVAKLFEPMPTPRFASGGLLPPGTAYLVGENPCVQFVPRSLLREVGERLDTCTCKPGHCTAPKPAWCIDSAKRAARDPERFARPAEGKSID